MRPIRVAIIGSGYIADYHARALRALPETVVQVVCGLDTKALNEFAARHGIAETTEDAAGLVSRDDIDAAVLCTPNVLHAPHAVAFLEHGKDVLVEKPMAVSAAEGAGVADTVQRTGRVLMVGHMWRFDREVNYVREAIQSGRIGRVVRTKGYGVHENWGPAGWFTRKDLAGGGALADMGVHAIDTTRFLLGDPRPQQVYARLGTYYGDYDVDDTGVLFITWDNAVMSIVESGWWQPHTDGPEASCQVFGTEGYASLFPTKLKVKEEGQWRQIAPSMPPRREHCDQHMYTRQMERFLDCIRTRRPCVPGAAEGQTVLRIVDAAYQSSREGRAVSL